ncbi:hypothetical protein XELAEV_18022082mg [Xenopus laevis]|uniref:Uncharacterized protein n=1 Tax=Xenopus laevis TaxID=8355 RepID=A0A974HMW5_XENLA|nr:hypothetical protein XELAEV_18022082mg [Xenopus laevis]
MSFLRTVRTHELTIAALKFAFQIERIQFEFYWISYILTYRFPHLYCYDFTIICDMFIVSFILSSNQLVQTVVYQCTFETDPFFK